MANNNKVSIQVDLQSKLKQTKEMMNTLKERGGFKNFDTAERELSNLIQELDAFSKSSKLTLKNLSSVDALFNRMTAILLKVANATGNVTKEFQELTKKISGFQVKQEAARSERSGILKKGKVNKETGRYELFTKYQNEVISQSNIKNKQGQSIKTAETFFKKFDAEGNPVADAFQNPEAAKKLYASLQRTQQENHDRLQKLNADIEGYRKAIEKATEELSTQSKFEESPIATQLVQNKINMNELINSKKEEAYSARSSGEATSSVKGLNEAIDKQSSALGRAFKQFTIYNVAIKAVKYALNEAKRTVQELDKYLTEQAMVTGLTREQTYGLVQSYQELALQCGATTKEIAQVSTEYMKQGKSIQESLVLTEAAVKAAKVARVSVGDSVNYLTTALNGFRLSANDAMKVSDKFAAVAASSATDYDELAIALSKVASQANLAGMSIDYTTALLTKGLETTREAPETMGTALKTIIARMRELSDYGETLEDGIDINNVETQLKYVDIELRNQQGELRSTEEVLDELGKKWDTLNKNQQAAIAKALAGTRQQSRLIAIMEDYERVTELQEIAAQSTGATVAQASVYLEGMEAAMNKIQVAWEKIVMTVTDSEVIIGVFDFIGGALDKIGDFLSTDFGLISTLTIVGFLTTAALGNKLKEIQLSKLQQQYALNEEKTKKSAVVLSKKQVVQKIKENLEQAKSLRTQLQINKAKLAELKLTIAKAAAEGKNTAAMESAAVFMEQEIEQFEKKNAEILTSIPTLEKELALHTSELEILERQESQLKSQESFIYSIYNGLSAFTGPLFAIIAAWETISRLISVVRAKQAAHHAQSMKEITKETTMNALNAAGSVIAKMGPLGIGLAAIIVAALTGTALLIRNAVKEKEENSLEGVASSVNKLGTEIYNLTEKANSLEQIGNSFDEIDNKIIKTNEDLKEMSTLLEQAADKLTEEEKAAYNALPDSQKRTRLSELSAKARLEANNKRNEIRDKIKNEQGILSSTSIDSEILSAQAQIYAINNNELYQHIESMTDLTNEESIALRELTQSILEEMNTEQAWGYAQEESADKIKNLANKVKDLGIAQLLTSDDASLSSKVEAYRTAINNLYGYEQEAFKRVYNQYEYFSKLQDNTVNFLDNKGLGGEKLNDLYSAWKKIQKEDERITQEIWESNFNNYINALASTNGDALKATQQVFGEYIQDNKELQNAFISAYGDAVQIGVLNMGQNMDKIKNSINNFYDKGLNWASMSESERAEFIQDNAELFADDLATIGVNEGELLLQAFESGNYKSIEEALKDNTVLQDKIDKQREDIRQELLIEEARVGKDRNEAYIAELKRYQAYLNNVDDLFKASLETRLKQEKEQIDEYKSFLEDQQKALEKSLNKRKEAYEKYFDAINQNEEDEDYEKQANILISNLNKLSSTANASAVQEKQRLEQELKKLEEERLKELRERAQEAVLENMDEELKEINEKFDKLLESNQALLAAMTGELKNPLGFITGLIGNKIQSGSTQLEMTDYIRSLQGTYGSVLGSGVNWDAIKVREENNQLFLTVNGREIALDANNEQNLYQAIMRALTEIGLR